MGRGLAELILSSATPEPSGDPRSGERIERSFEALEQAARRIEPAVLGHGFDWTIELWYLQSRVERLRAQLASSDSTVYRRRLPQVVVPAGKTTDLAEMEAIKEFRCRLRALPGLTVEPRALAATGEGQAAYDLLGALLLEVRHLERMLWAKGRHWRDLYRRGGGL